MAKKADSRRKSMKKSPIQKSKTSYLTRLIYWIENRNISSTYIYISIWMVLTLTQLVPQYAENNGIVMETLPVHLWLAAMPPLHMILIRYLDSNALKSVRNLRPVLKLKGKYLKDLEHNVLTLPRTTTFIFGFVVLILIIISEKINGVYQLEHLKGMHLSQWAFRFIYLLSWFFFGNYLHHTIYQLNLIFKIFKDFTKIDIYQVKLLYSLTNVSAMNAGSIALIVYGWNLVNPIVLTNDPISLVIMLAILFLALFAFIFPLMDIHNRLSFEKDIALNQCSIREGKLISELNQKVDESDLTNLDLLRSGINNLELEFSILKRISTWPWEPETFRLLFSALLLPMVIWFTQYALEKFVF